ncbi:MAG: hypothetical protein AAGJ50_08300 [Pseudomonadota bacterium]
MQITLATLSVLAFALSMLLFDAAAHDVHNVQALIMLVISALFFVGFALLRGIEKNKN